MEEQVLLNILRQGTVSSVNTDTLTVRVQFSAMGIVSGEMKVLQHKKAKVIVKETEITYGVQETTLTYGVEEASLSFAGETQSHTHVGKTQSHAHEGITELHDHEAEVEYWMPAVGDQVLCLYLPVPDGDGYVLGGVM